MALPLSRLTAEPEAWPGLPPRSSAGPSLAATAPPLSAREPRGLAGTGASVLSGTARTQRGKLADTTLHGGTTGGADLEDLDSLAMRFASDVELDRIANVRRNYPNKKPPRQAVFDDPMGLGEKDEDAPQRRIMGFSLGFEKVFATTSVKLPVSAYLLFAELHSAHEDKVFSRVFNGLHTVLDLKKWIYEKLLVPKNSYDLSYAEAGKTTLTDNLRLLTMEDSLDTRTLATTRAVHRLYSGVPGVHSIGDVGVTRLYMRLKCRTCGNLQTSLQSCKKFKKFGHIEPVEEQETLDSRSNLKSVSDGPADSPGKKAAAAASNSASSAHTKFETFDDMSERAARHVKSMAVERRMTFGSKVHQKHEENVDPEREEIWARPHEDKHCLFHQRGLEMFQAARTHGGHSELARIYIACGKEPSKKLKLAANIFSARDGASKILY